MKFREYLAATVKHTHVLSLSHTHTQTKWAMETEVKKREFFR